MSDDEGVNDFVRRCLAAGHASPLYTAEKIIRRKKKPQFLLPGTENQSAELTTKQISQNVEVTTIHGSFQDFSSDMLSLLDDDSSSDVTIKSSTETLKVHKCILCARSPVFKAMFNSSMQESSEGIVSIDDIDSETVRDLVYFIYSNQLQNMSVAKACDLLNVAEKYQMQSLKSICVEYLGANLKADNVFLILPQADLYDETLKTQVMKFISENFSVLKRTEEWKNMQSQYPLLALEVFNVVVENLP